MRMKREPFTAIDAHCGRCASIAVKGSRFMAMERVVDALAQAAASEQEGAHAA